MTIGKTLTGIVVALLVVAAIAVYMLVKNIDALVVTVVESVGSQVTQTSVTLDGAQIQLKEGRGALSGLRVANPSGFTSPNAFEMKDIALALDLGSMTGPVYVIKEVTIDGAQLVVEQTAEGNNLKQLADNIKQSAPAAEQPGEQPPSQPGSQPEQAPEKVAGEDILLAIEQITFVNSSATLITEKYGQQTLPLPGIVLSNLGDRENGLTPNQLTREIFLQLMKQAETRVAERLTEQAKEELEKAAKKKLDEAAEKLKKVFGGE